MKIIVDKHSPISVHDQIYSEIENRIVSGILKAETRLPSLRKMCLEVGVSHMTMVKVYERLEENGLVEKIHGKGTYVKSQFRNMSPSQADQHRLVRHTTHELSQGSLKEANWQDHVEDYITTAGFRFNDNLKHSVKGTNLSLACLGQHLLPTQTILNHFQESSLTKHINDWYPPIEGIQTMRQAAVKVLSERNVDVEVAQTLITVGSQQAIRLIARTFIGPGDVVVVGAPTYPGAIDVFKNRGAEIVEVPVDRDGLNTMSLLSVCECKKVKLVYTMPCFQNPTGAVMSMERKQELLELANYHNFMILEDEVNGQLSYEGSTLPIKALDTSGRVLYAFGFSKLYGHALRLSVIAGAEKLLSKIISAKSSSDGGAPLINQLMMASFAGSDIQKHYMTDLVSSMKQVRDDVFAALIKYMPDYVKIEKPKGGMLFWLTFPKDFNCNLLHYKSIEKFQITFLPGEFCYNSKQGRNQMRICFTSVKKDLVIDSIIKIASLVEGVYSLSRQF
tara:strand:- start:451 stop:1965 length:1515 start_codon:yes stop_codon:yes gene_type:complete